MDYNEAIEYLYSRLPMFSRVGAAAYKPGLQTSLDLDSHFGHPHRRFKSIHIGGTNGKGSTSHTLAAILQAQGYRTGLYTSPHLVDFRERMRVDGRMISREAVVDFVRRFRASGYEGSPSFFELTMMMAFDFFASEQVDYAVIEVGMGGRLDSTNIITPQACVITNISPDHMQFLGDTLPAIAAEKAGIIKGDIPVVVGEAEGEIREVFVAKASSAGAPITFAEDHPMLTSAEPDENGGWRCVAEGLGEFRSPLGGLYQVKNINTVLAAVGMLRGCGVVLSDEAVRTGFGEVVRLTGFRGRWTRLRSRPAVICDTGHNLAGLTYNMRQLDAMRRNRPGARLHIVMGFVADKAIDDILPLFPADATYYLTNADIPRALPVEQLAGRCAAHGIKGDCYPHVGDAYTAALAASEPDDIIYVGGSTFVVADLLAELDKETTVVPQE